MVSYVLLGLWTLSEGKVAKTHNVVEALGSTETGRSHTDNENINVAVEVDW